MGERFDTIYAPNESLGKDRSNGAAQIVQNASAQMTLLLALALIRTLCGLAAPTAQPT